MHLTRQSRYLNFSQIPCSKHADRTGKHLKYLVQKTEIRFGGTLQSFIACEMSVFSLPSYASLHATRLPTSSRSHLFCSSLTLALTVNTSKSLKTYPARDTNTRQRQRPVRLFASTSWPGGTLTTIRYRCTHPLFEPVSVLSFSPPPLLTST